MKLFLELVLQALRSALLIRYAPELQTSLSEELGSDEYASLKTYADEKGITHATMLAFLTAADRIRLGLEPPPAVPRPLAHKGGPPCNRVTASGHSPLPPSRWPLCSPPWRRNRSVKAVLSF